MAQTPKRNTDCAQGLNEDALHHPTTPAGTRPLPFVWTLALMRFLSRTCTKLNHSHDAGVTLWEFSVYKLCDQTHGCLWKVSLSNTARKLVDFLLTGTHYNVFVHDDALPFANGPRTGPPRHTNTLEHNKKSIENVLVDEMEGVAGRKIPRGCRRSMFRLIERIEAAMLFWTVRAVKNDQRCMASPALFTSLYSAGSVQSREEQFPDVAATISRRWDAYKNVCIKKSTQTAPSQTSSESDDSASDMSMPPSPLPTTVVSSRSLSPMPLRVRDPLVPTSTGVDRRQPDDYALVCAYAMPKSAFASQSELPTIELELRKAETREADVGSNEMIVRHLLQTQVQCGDCISGVAARLRYEREVWGLSKSLIF